MYTSAGRESDELGGVMSKVLGIIMVGTGVLMSQLLVEHVLDTTADEEHRMWVYAPQLPDVIVWN